MVIIFVKPLTRIISNPRTALHLYCYFNVMAMSRIVQSLALGHMYFHWRGQAFIIYSSDINTKYLTNSKMAESHFCEII